MWHIQEIYISVETDFLYKTPECIRVITFQAEQVDVPSCDIALQNNNTSSTNEKCQEEQLNFEASRLSHPARSGYLQ